MQVITTPWQVLPFPMAPIRMTSALVPSAVTRNVARLLSLLASEWRLLVADEGHKDAEREDDQADDAERDGDVIGGDDAVNVLENGEDGEREASMLSPLPSLA